MRELKNWLFKEVDNAPLIFFRICFGFLIAAEAFGAILTGWVRRTLIEPDFTFNFIGFEFLQPLPGYGMYFYFATMGVFGLLVMLGWRYRMAVIAYGVMWTCVYLMQKTSYNNHYYLLVLMCGLMATVPANRYFSIDAKRNPMIRSLSCPNWSIQIFILQLFIVYTFAAIAKIYPDWLAAKPIAIWFEHKAHFWLIGPLLTKEWMHYAVAYGGILFDLLIVPLLLWRKTRLFAFGLSLFFHLFNSAVFHIGIFPYMMLGMKVLFFEPNKVRAFFFKAKPAFTSNGLPPKTLGSLQKVGIVAFGIYFLVQLALPVRHWFYPGSAHWTEEAHRLSWHMMLRSKSGFIHFMVKDPVENKTWKVYPDEFLTPKQSRAVATRPDMTWQFVQFLKKHYQAEGLEEVEIYARSQASLNGRPYQKFIDPEVNLAAVEWHPIHPSPWILPLEENQTTEKSP